MPPPCDILLLQAFSVKYYEQMQYKDKILSVASYFVSLSKSARIALYYWPTSVKLHKNMESDGISIVEEM